MKILAIEKEIHGVTEDKFTEKILKEEAMKAWELNQAGIIRELYFHKDEHYAILLLECNEVKEAKSILGDLPLVKEGLIKFDIIPLIPYSGFERLFTQ